MIRPIDRKVARLLGRIDAVMMAYAQQQGGHESMTSPVTDVDRVADIAQAGNTMPFRDYRGKPRVPSSGRGSGARIASRCLRRFFRGASGMKGSPHGQISCLNGMLARRRISRRDGYRVGICRPPKAGAAPTRLQMVAFKNGLVATGAGSSPFWAKAATSFLLWVFLGRKGYPANQSREQRYACGRTPCPFYQMQHPISLVRLTFGPLNGKPTPVPTYKVGMRCGNRSGFCRQGALTVNSGRVFLWSGASGGIHACRSRRVHRFSTPAFPGHQCGNCGSGLSKGPLPI